MYTGITLVLPQIILDSYVISIPIYIPISHTQVAPYISVEHITLDLITSGPCSSHLFLHVHEISQNSNGVSLPCLSITFSNHPPTH